MKRFLLPIITAILFLTSGCLESLGPNEEELGPTGTIRGRVTYTGQWPPESQLQDIRFVAMKFQPRNAQDILFALLTGELVSTEGLRRNVAVDTFSVRDVPNGTYVYNGIARQFGPNQLNDWDALGLYKPNKGVFTIRGNDIFIEINVDFNNLPPFPPTKIVGD
jgi:hypothetical protein